jgi:hypothetical protein
MALMCLTHLQATTVAPPEFAQLVNEADYVVQAVVKSVTMIEKANPGKRTLPYSLVELEVKQVIVGTPPSPLVLEVLGGKIGEREMYIEGAPRFTVGEEAIFFVQGNQTQIFPLARMMHGLYPILKDKTTGREFVARSNGEPMTDVTEVSEPMHREPEPATALARSAKTPLAPNDFVSQIRLAAKAPPTREK